MAFWGELGDRIVGAPSILAADFANLAEEVRRAASGGAELVHFDTMDNHFVPNLTIGPVVAASLVEAVEIPVDAHLMVDNPDNLIRPFIEPLLIVVVGGIVGGIIIAMYLPMFKIFELVQ